MINKKSRYCKVAGFFCLKVVGWVMVLFFKSADDKNNKGNNGNDNKDANANT